jgi:hypothetical protein
MSYHGLGIPYSPFGGVRIVVVPNWPRELVGHWIEPFEAAPWFARILRWFGISPFIQWIRRPMTRPKDPVMNWTTGALYCAPEHEKLLREALRDG